MRILTLCLLSVVGFGCGSSSGGDMSTQDLSMSAGADMALFSACGHPGDKGNSKGIGQYCNTAANVSCPTGMMLTCSDILNSPGSNMNTFFCTTPCSMSMSGTADAAECGENSLCQCKTIGCGCTPAACGTVNKGG